MVAIANLVLDNPSHLCRNSPAASPTACQSRHAVYVCICNGVTDHDIRQAAQAGCKTLPELMMRTGAGANCGSCLDLAAQLLDQTQPVRALPLPVLQRAA